MPAKEDVLIDLLYEDELEDIHVTSGEEKHFHKCYECHGTEGRHEKFCTHNHSIYFWDTEEEFETRQQ